MSDRVNSVKHRKKRSAIWDHFDQIDNKKAKCKYCLVLLSVGPGCGGNLLRHLKTKHPTIPLEPERQQVHVDITPVTPSSDPVPSTSQTSHSIIPDPDVLTTAPRTTTLGDRQQPGLSSIQQYFYSKKPLNVRRNNEIDRQLLMLITKEYQPFSIVEDMEFRKFVQILNPAYSLPTRKTLSESLLPKTYHEIYEIVKEDIKTAEAVCVTTDGWTSINNDSFIAVTAHFIDKNIKLKSYLLGCVEYTKNHTARNLASFLQNVFIEWGIEHRISAVVSDNAPNILAAVKEGGWRSIGCFAHKINLLVQDALGMKKDTPPASNSIAETINKVKSTVQYFKKSSQAKAKLNEMQKNLGTTQLKLKQDVPTRWNSTYDMLARVVQTKDSLISTIALLRSELALTNDEWSIIEMAVPILKIFYEVTKEVSGEKYVTLSKVIVYCRIMKNNVNKLSMDTTDVIPLQIAMLIEDLKTGLDDKFNNIENEHLHSEATVLDPRFKSKGFQNERHYNSAVNRIRDRLNYVRSETIIEQPSTSTENSANISNFSIWDDFDCEIRRLVPENPTAARIRELDKYLEEDILNRSSDPLIWWEERKTIYPMLYAYMKKRLCLLATSVPCERIFSKAGSILTEKRSRITSSKVNQILFLNQNM